MIDEFSTAHIKATVLNAMCDGTYQYPVKGGAARAVQAYILVTGNKHPADIYPNAWQYINARFNVYRLDEGDNEPQGPEDNHVIAQRYHPPYNRTESWDQRH